MVYDAKITQLSTKGQLVIPKNIREKMNWHPGDQILIETVDGKVLMRKLSLNEILKEAESDWEEGKTEKLYPREK